ncbi:unnamed protein product [Cylicocyclus nassatus]|uniref:3-oxo-5alpha-steroid 4-dehydrogenase (NADP(+)) n=1 Tax=Cylicocyclus nassatus TaxID=53992 RepID=A0AA36M6T9_CYLNA|nr:unnamed protein product [Cylicocyclus nassatus]
MLPDAETSFISWLSWMMILGGVLTMVALMLGMRAVYGRYAAKSALVIPARLAWAVQEFPSFAIPAYYACECQSIAGAIILALFIIHYFNRTFIYPLHLNSANATPWYICLSAAAFCSVNGYMQGSFFGKYYHPTSFFGHPLTYVGIAMFAAGMYINMQSDHILRNLRKPGETCYRIPRGGMFEYVSGANYLGEIIEWTGYAVASRTLPAVAFAIFTASNIGPRAVQHHQWYLNKFPDYPKERKALIPFLL